MTLTVQGTTSPPWPDPTTTAVAPVTPPAPDLQQPSEHHAAATHVHASAATSAQPYSDSLRVQAFRRDAVAISTQAAPATATASTASAPAVKVAPATLVNPLAVQPETPMRTPPPPAAPPAITAPAAVDEQSGARGS